MTTHLTPIKQNISQAASDTLYTKIIGTPIYKTNQLSPHKNLLPQRIINNINQQPYLQHRPFVRKEGQKIQNQHNALQYRQITNGQLNGGLYRQVNKQNIEKPMPPPPQRRVQMVPYEQKYIDYVQQVIRVPVQRMYTDYYQIQHIIQYVPIQKQEIVYVTQPQQTVNMRLQYVPVQKKLIHISQKDAKQAGIIINNSSQSNLQIASPLYQPIGVNPHTRVQKPINANVENISGSGRLKGSRTNYVTSQGYDPDAHIRQIDRVLSQSGVRHNVKSQ